VDGCPARRRGDQGEKKTKKKKKKKSPRMFSFVENNKMMRKGGRTNLLGSNIRRFLNLELLALVGTLSVLTRSDDSMDDGFGLPFNPGKTTRYQQ
jgi:hypothetical protein